MGLLRRGPIAFGAVVAVVLSCGSVREDETLCEEAVARLDDCCPKIDSRRFNCTYNEGCGTDLNPVLSAKASNCIRDTGCTDLVDRGICDGMVQLSYQPYPFQTRADFEAEACR